VTARDRTAWLAARRRGITGTDVAAILGLNPWRNALDVYLDKIGEGEPTPVNEAMWWGTYLEDGMARRYAELHDLAKGDLLRGAAIARAFPKRRVLVFGSGPRAQVLVRHPVHPFLLATLDGLMPKLARGLELKTASDHAVDDWGEQGTDQIPLHYLTQCAHYMGVAEVPVWDVGALIGAGARIGGNLALYQVFRNHALETEITDTAVRFWREHVLKRRPPAIDGSASWQGYLAKTYAKSTGVVLKATARINELAEQYREAQQRRRQAETDELAARNHLAAIVRSADKARGAFGSVGWVRPAPTRVTDWETLARFLRPTPAQIARFTATEQHQAYLRAWWSRKVEP
jgi:predicted phage-related endonuclease